MTTSPFQKTVEIRFRNADPAGIAFFGHAYELAHDLYEDFVKHLGFEWKAWFANPEWAVPIRHSACEHLQPMFAGQSLHATIQVEKIGTTSFTLKYCFTRNEKTLCEVTLVHIFISKKEKTSIAIPSEVLTRLEVYQSKQLPAQ